MAAYVQVAFAGNRGESHSQRESVEAVKTVASSALRRHPVSGVRHRFGRGRRSAAGRRP